jgi:hypothetical protein
MWASLSGRRRLVEEQRRVEAELRARLEAYHPDAVRVVSSLDCDVALAFIAGSV